MSCRVTVAQGILEGQVRTTYSGKKYYSFEGIPYAKPPVERLRFRDPQEPDSWTGIRDATTPGNKCVQINPYSPTNLIGCEDCLYLNVYTPSLPVEKLEKLPVLFFVHGGRFLFGYGDYYQPDYLIRHDVILVTINYRLNIFGFLCLNIPEVPGNAGLKDTIMALKWVKNNIKYFNGDENNVTAFGESAGAGVVTSYLTSKMADNLCHKIIAQSGNVLSDLYIVKEDQIAKARYLTSIMGKEISDVREIYEYLLTAPVEELLMAFISAELSRPPATINAYLLPVVEKKFEGVEQFFDEDPIVTMRENRFKKLPVLVTLNSHESAPFLRKDEHGNTVYENNLQYFIPRYLGIENDSPRALKFAKKLRDSYFDGKDVANEEKYLDFISDAYFARDTVMLIEYLSKFNKDTFFCFFSYCGNMNTSLMRKLGFKGATHGDLIQYVFYRKNKAVKCTEKDQKIVDFLSEAWCNFAKNGKPTWRDQRIQWLPYDHRNRLCMHVDEELQLVTNPKWKKYLIWADLMGERCKFFQVHWLRSAQGFVRS
ncbi:unnamed protein product [Parnassius apollo]|nr:unnamed protein product [Parnassius apollo]